MRNIIVLCTLVLATQTAFALNAVKEYEIKPDDYGMDYKEVKIPTEDKFIKLNGWYFPTMEKGSKKLMIMAHDGDGNMSDNLEVASNFLSLGYHVLMFDYRGYGESDDFEVKAKFYIYSQFYQDFSHVLDYAKKYYASLSLVDVWGEGIGAGMAIGIGANNLDVRRVIADGPYDNFENVKNDLEAAKGEKVLTPFGYNKTEMEPTFSLTENTCKHLYGVLFIVAENDPVTGADDLKAIAKESKAKIMWYIRKDADDNSENFSSGKNDYFEQVKAFLEKTK